jgi:hypothetical protein
MACSASCVHQHQSIRFDIHKRSITRSIFFFVAAGGSGLGTKVAQMLIQPFRWAGCCGAKRALRDKPQSSAHLNLSGEMAQSSEEVFEYISGEMDHG